MKHLFSSWAVIAEQIKQASHILFLSDYDGTLTPIVEKPEMAIISEDTRLLLQSLAYDRHFTVGIISGRAMADLKEKVNIEGIIYAGNHGFEIEGPGLNFVNPIVEEIKPFFRVIGKILTMTVGSIKGVSVEDKGITLSVHYRQADEEKVNDVENLVKRALVGPASSIFKITSGKKVYEVRPAANWDKGKAIRLLMKKYGKGGRLSGLLPIYLGDDLTDEDGFRTIEKYGKGITVYVGRTKADSAARYYLDSPLEVSRFLDMLLESSQRGQVCEQLTTS